MSDSTRTARRLRVAVNAASQSVGGGISVARDLTRAMAMERPDWQFSLICSSASLARSPFPENVLVVANPALAQFLTRTRWEQFDLPRSLARDGYDVLLSLGGFAVLRCPVPQVSVWQNPNIFTRVRVRRRFAVEVYILVQRLAQRLSMRCADLNVFLTRDSAIEAATRWDLSRIPHVVIPNGVRASEAARSDRGSDRGYVLAVGHSYFHKNYEALIDAADSYRRRFGEVPEVLIAGGAVDAAYHEQLEGRIRERNLDDRVRFLGPQSPDRVASLYTHAKAYVMTSVLESFGLTPLEAMVYGVPVLAAQASCIPEVCADAALYCDPLSPDDIAEKLHQLLHDEALRGRLREQGYQRVRRFSWSESARRYLAELESCVATTHMDSSASVERAAT